MSNAALKTPKYPIITWPVYYTENGDDLEIECDGGGASIDPSDGTFDGKYGFSNNSSNVAQTDGLAGFLATRIETILQVDAGFGSATVSAEYVWDKPGWPRVKFTVANVGGNDVTMLAYSQEVADFFGIDFSTGGLVTIDGGTGIGYMDFNGPGYWSANNLTCYDDRVDFSPATYTAQSLDGSTNKTVSWSTVQTKRQITLPFVRPPYIWLYRRQDAAWSDPSGLSTEDPNNLFANMMEAARTNNTSHASTVFRIYSGDGVYRNASIMDNVFIKDPTDSIIDSNGRSATYFEVSIPFKDLGGDGI